MSNLIKTLNAFLSGRPSVLYHQPTWKCDCKCEFCDVWKVKPENGQVLSPEQLKMILKKLADAGFTTYSLYGGEPLYYPGIGDIFRYAHGLGLKVIVCTNGSRLKEFSKELAPYFHYILLSLDAAGETHNQLRNHAGLFDKALAGVEAVKSQNPKGKIIIWSNLNKKNKDQIPALASLARDLRVFIEFFPVVNLLGCGDNLILSANEKQEAFEKVIELKGKRYPVLNTLYSLELMKNSRPFKCNMPRTSLRMMWEGSIWPCESRLFDPQASYGNGQDLDFKKLSSAPAFKYQCRHLEKCNLCLFPCVAHYSNNLWMQGARRFFSEIYYQNIYSFPKS